MNIRKLVFAVVLSLLMVTNEVCFAQIMKSDLSIGGVYLNQNFSDVKAMYGNPVSERKPAGYGTTYSFANNGTVFDVHVNRSNVVKGVRISGNNGLALDSSGIKFGSSLSTVLEYYGNPDRIESRKENSGQILRVVTYRITDKGITQELSFYIDDASGQVEMIYFDEFYG